MSENGPDLSTTHPETLPGTPRLYVDLALAANAVLTLPVPQSHYLAQVMRRQPGDMVRLFDDRSGEWAARVLVAGRKAVEVRIETRISPRETVPDLWLCFAPLKRGRIDWVVEKGCELGVARLVPVLTRRTVVDKLNLDRLRAHMVEAAEQCERTALPELVEPVTLTALLKAWPAERALIFADETGGAPLAEALRAAPAPAAILIGPEGGFDAAERDAIRALPQCRPVSLGPRILRADTAAAVAVGVWQAVMGDGR
ncbi:16S rRNA (uracil(1498)-N(3))-methyltransferase [Sandarakinorhabdus sp. DWP1-3-1]|uniref:16S rRNA (uracil(1498)-N(3))-methyltransferase n=1 Tax=Sandarakinorhabdus sp. DWP1-3-1 TaxID=2804627 RepID=UPI003CEA72E7